MNATKWRTLAELLGLLAVVASLVFVGIETQNSTRQAILNTQALEIASYQELIGSILELNSQALSNPEVAALMYKAYRTNDKLTDLESFRFSRAMFSRFRLGDIAYFQYQRGVIDEERLRSVLEIINLGNQRVQVFWVQHRQNFAASYALYIDQAIDEEELKVLAE